MNHSMRYVPFYLSTVLMAICSLSAYGASGRSVSAKEVFIKRQMLMCEALLNEDIRFVFDIQTSSTKGKIIVSSLSYHDAEQGHLRASAIFPLDALNIDDDVFRGKTMTLSGTKRKAAYRRFNKGKGNIDIERQGDRRAKLAIGRIQKKGAGFESPFALMFTYLAQSSEYKQVEGIMHVKGLWQGQAGDKAFLSPDASDLPSDLTLDIQVFENLDENMRLSELHTQKPTLDYKNMAFTCKSEVRTIDR